MLHEGIHCREWDIQRTYNLLHNHVACGSKHRIAQLQQIITWFGFPCNTFSRARRLDGGPPPLRSDHFPIGLPDLTGKDLARVQEANQLADIMCDLILLILKRIHFQKKEEKT